jgi:uncharacterized protein YkvS
MEMDDVLKDGHTGRVKRGRNQSCVYFTADVTVSLNFERLNFENTGIGHRA